MTDWQIGDLAECIRDDWENPDAPIIPTAPKIGDQRMVVDTDVAISFCSDCRRSHAMLGLSFIGGDGWYWQADRFRKIEPKGQDVVREAFESRGYTYVMYEFPLERFAEMKPPWDDE